MNSQTCKIITIANQKGGVGKTTTTVNLAQALTTFDKKTLVVDFDPQANTTQASGIQSETIHTSVADLIRERSIPEQNAIYQGESFDLIPATGLLSQVQREMVGITNSELRLAHRLNKLRTHYSLILIDTPPTFGPLMNSALNAADRVIVPVDPGGFALQGIKSLLAEIEEIRAGTNPEIEVLGYLMTLFDSTRIAEDILDSLIENFGDQVFETKIRRIVKFREASILGLTIFHHAPQSPGTEAYLSLAQEVLDRIHLKQVTSSVQSEVVQAQGVRHE